ncbi:hypothetical protein [Streptomyces abikoensis]|uniref:Transposase n=1 Tax=Streptomyces abikoensis TaxID=97398 RepID=A0ABW7T7V1_9ACTN
MGQRVRERLRTILDWIERRHQALAVVASFTTPVLAAWLVK